MGGVTSLPEGPGPAEPALDAVGAVVPDLLSDAIGRHPTSLGTHLDSYLAAVVRELQLRGVVTGATQRTDPAKRLIGSVVVDCAALRSSAVASEHAAPVIVTWDEITGWCAGLHHDSTHSSRRYLHPDLLPPSAAVADFVVGLAVGRRVGTAHPLDAPGRPSLRLVT